MRELHLELSTKGLPGEPLAVRTQLIEAIEREVGKVGNTGAGRGAMEIWMHVEDPQAAATTIRGIADRLGISDWLQISLRALHVMVLIECGDDFQSEQADALIDKILGELEGDTPQWAWLAGRASRPWKVDVILEVDEVAPAIAKLQAMVARLGAGGRARIFER